MKEATVKRTTNETDVSVLLSLRTGGSAEISVNTGCGFLDHMLTLFAVHGGMALTVTAKGDCEVDFHHTVEDTGIALGQAFLQALGDKAGITRYGSIMLPMDEALVMCAVDISGRGHLEFALDIPTQKVGNFDTELCREFFEAFAENARLTLHLRSLCGVNSHHIIEAAFKACGRALKTAIREDKTLGGAVPSTKGVL